MPQNYSGRLTLIAAVLAAALLAIFLPSIAAPRTVGLNPNLPFSTKVNLRQGIDMVGGTSMLYEIKQPDGRYDPDLAKEVMQALKRRIDPQGVMNLIWRPQGANRLEIQMPLAASTGESAQRQKALDDARTALEATNIDVPAVVAAIEKAGGNLSDAQIAPLAAGSDARQKMLSEMNAAYADLQKATAALDVSASAKAQEKYESLQRDLATTNLTPARLEEVLNLKNSRAAQLATLKLQSAGFASRAAAIDAYEKARAAVAQGSGGFESAADLKRKLRGAGVLEFHILADPNDPDLQAGGGYQGWINRLRRDGPRPEAGDKFRWFESDKPEEFRGRGGVEYNDRTYVLASVKREDSLDHNSPKWALTHASSQSDQRGAIVVKFEFDTPGASLLGDLTTRNVKKPMAILLDQKVISAPNINTPITGGTGEITGGGDSGFSTSEADYLVRTMSAGSLPAQLNEEPISERTVGPQIGEENLRAGLLACGLALVVVGIFLVTYYHLSGAVAFFAVLLNLVIILGAMAALNATFTLPGIAAVVLTVGSAVDANVLIFERLREEQLRGLSLRMAFRNAYDRAFGAIFDSNMTTLITSFFLILFGTEEVKGFGITLIIGILASLFTALFVTKTIFGLMIDHFDLRRLGSLPLSYPAWDKALRPNINWVGLSKYFIATSVVLIGLGTVLFVKYLSSKQMLAIDFAGGTAVTFELKEPQTAETVRDWFDKQSQKDPASLPPGAMSVIRVGEDSKVWELNTPNTDARAVREAVVAAVGTNLKAEIPSTFEGLGQPADQAVKRQVLPISAENLADTAGAKWPGGAIPEAARKYQGGAAILLRNLNPPLSADSITSRLKRQQLQLHDTPAGNAPFNADFTVVAYGGNDRPVNSAIILVNDPAAPFSRDARKWEQTVVTPMWGLLGDALARPAELQQVKNFDASVAGDTTRDALIALTLSIIAIMIYIWFRFGNLTYGTATVVALLHDVLFCIAGLGIAHALSGTGIGNVLKLQPFRVDLTIVAGILTVMGYSMLDTIVVFDRIRELRGKFGHVSTRVINDAVNQTLSRTLLTAGTTVISIGIMYFFGGPGIHGFTFVLFVGILVGTYSSIAIASPVLLLGRPVTQESAGVRTAGQLERARPSTT